MNQSDSVVQKLKCRGPESNWGHADFQSAALPPELPRRDAIVNFSVCGCQGKVVSLCLSTKSDQGDASGT